MTITVKDGDKFYRLSATRAWLNRHDNGTLVSCGLTVGEASTISGHVWLTKRAFDIYVKRFPTRVIEIDRDTYNHSGCQSSCIRRGHSVCRW